MIIEFVRFKLKDGRDAVLHSPKEEDVESTLEYLVISARETDFILRYPEECGKYTLEEEKKLFEQKNESSNEAMIMCVVDGKVVGNCEISFFKGMKTKHRAKIGIALVSNFWNQGIGTKMFEEMIRLAENREGVMQMELEFVEGNARARHLYEKMGFRITGVRPNAICLKDAANHRLNSFEGETWFENHMKIDNTKLSPEEVADLVIEQFHLVANDKAEKEYRFGV